MMLPVILFLDTNILLDNPRLSEYRLSSRPLTLVVIPEVMRELRGLSRAPSRGEVGSALQALALLEPLGQLPGRSEKRFPGRPELILRLLRGDPSALVPTDRQLVLRAKGDQRSHRGALVAVLTRDRGVAEIARAEGVKSILLRGGLLAGELDRRIAEHDSLLDIEL